MFKLFKSSLKTFTEKSNFEKLDTSFKDYVFYAESKADWPHLEPVISALLAKNKKVSYLTSDKNDIAFKLKNEKFKVFWIGDGTARTVLFQTIKCKLMIMTMPDLDCFALKRSNFAVKYVYIFHSIVSSHTIYREEAFDHYDIVFCVGEHHRKEIRAREESFQLNKKNLIAHGYGKLDGLIENIKISKHKVEEDKIVIAPSWGEGGLVETGLAEKIIDKLLEGNFSVYLRVHPMTTKSHEDVLKNLDKKYEKEKFKLITDMNETQSVLSSALMISDWSGAALDYAFSQIRPVVFIDTPPKINNKNWQSIDMDSFEKAIRPKIGEVVRLSEIDNIADIIKKFLLGIEAKREEIIKVRSESVYHVGNSGVEAAKKLEELLLN